MPFRKNLFGARWLILFLWLLGNSHGVRGAIQFDVFVGYENAVRSGGWLPVGFEIYNDGPSFEGMIELKGAGFGVQSQQYAVSLPNGTRKRLVIPAFFSSGASGPIDAKLYDASGKERAERTGQVPNIVSWENVLLGSLPALSQAGPVFPDLEQVRSEMQPRTARIPSEFFPDNPIALEGLTALYLNSARALDLKAPQVEALQSWVHGGGHLIVGVDQATDLKSAAWLGPLLPALPGAVVSQRVEGLLHRWVTEDSIGHTAQSGSPFRHLYEPSRARSSTEPRGDRGESVYAKLKADRDFEAAEWAIHSLKLAPGATVAAGTRERPLIVSGPRGRGMVTVLAFNPEREPFKAWKLRPYFWSRLSGVPDEALRKDAQVLWGGKSLDSIFGAMIETRQVRKLPVGMLLLLLLVYLVVIGPFDRWWLKKINRPMLTWVTFPAYVAFFSLLIYYIGFRLRAGQTEWNELHVVDVIPRATDSVLRGRTYASIYSPANQNYKIVTETPYASLRSEFSGFWTGLPADGKSVLRLSQKPGFEGQLYVPVWSSQLNIADWQTAVETPLVATFTATANGGKLQVNNPRSKPVAGLWMVANREVFPLGALDAGAGKEFELVNGKGSRPLKSWLQNFNETFRTASTARERVLGGNEGTHIDAWDQASIAASFASLLTITEGQGRDLVYPMGMDLTPLVDRGDAVLFAWLQDDTLVPLLNRFPALRSARGTLLRVVLPSTTENR